MKKIFLMGRSEAGKTSLTQALKGEELHSIKIWPDGTEFVEENALSVAVSRLRGKIEDNPSKPQHILNVYGIGYVWR